MSTAANPNVPPGAHPGASPWNQPWNNQAGNNQNWQQPPFWQPPFWHPSGMSRGAGIAAMVLGFALFWPIGLAILAFLLATGRLACRRHRWDNGSSPNEWQPIVPPWSNWTRPDDRQPRSSGNHAFDEYRTETIRRLEEEQTEFSSFLERLRFAKDKAEFDQFMAERRQAPRPPSAETGQPQS